MISPRQNVGPDSQSVLRPLATTSNSAIENLFTLARRWYFVLLMVSAVCSAGSWGTGDGIAPVDGVVTIDGKPLTEGFVFVTPTEGKMAKGAIQADGTFVLGQLLI